MKKFFTSESVTEGHPDKVCDQISDAVLDAIMKDDPMGRVACECIATTGLVMVSGEITTNITVDIQKVVRDTLSEIGYVRAKYGFDAESCAVLVSIDEQSPDIALGVNKSLEAKSGDADHTYEIGAGDQGIMFGYACDQTPEYMPLPISLAHKLAMKLSEKRKDGTLEYLRPDGKTQVTVEYDDEKPVRVDTIVISTQHAPDINRLKLEDDLRDYVIQPVIDGALMDENTKIYINPTGNFVIGGPQGDTGLTGRKIIVDTYGGYARHGGGAFSGKDPTKVDRSAAYMARYIAKNIVAAGLAKSCEIELGYAIGKADPVSIFVETFGTSDLSQDQLVDLIQSNFPLRPKAIIDYFDLRRPIYKNTASYGHFGREDQDFPWEKLDKVEDLKKYQRS